jgi:primosomal protein N' (replication factor Y) (superfamily II helicase)
MASETPILLVALDVPLAKHFDFLCKDASSDDIGRLVVVPFSGKQVVGIAVGVAHSSEVPSEKLRAVDLVQRATPPLASDILALVRFCERYYHAPFGQIAINIVPPLLRIAARQLKPPRATKPRRKTATTASAAVAFTAPTLNTDQQMAFDAISGALGSYSAWLLEGITGSGKTEVYLHAIAATLARGQQALVLVPEINLTPQFMKHIVARFPAQVIVTQHSGMAAGARLVDWRLAESGAADIVVGTRLAIFTPMPKLGLIVVDEEHDASFKQQEGVRYSARDVAVFRASTIGCPIVLGSATPAIETLDNVTRGRFKRLALTQRAVAAATLPRVEFIHLDSEKAPDGLTATLLAAIDATIKRGEQAMVFINRRGYAPALVCAACGWMPECRRCSARMVFHRGINKLRCHHCGAETKPPKACADCHETTFHPAGQGTERIEAALREALPTARIARVDRDATRRKGSAAAIFDATSAGALDILVGTQMLAKGHDFPNITLVGVVNADGAVFSADFRAAERMAQQLMQVAGRAGRSALPGRVLVQTRHADHPVYQALQAHDYARFVSAALVERQLMQLPPFTYLALLRAEAKQADKVNQFMRDAQHAAQRLSQSHAQADAVRVWEPVASTLERKAGYTRRQLMLQSPRRTALQTLLTALIAELRVSDNRSVKWVIDVDPIDV